MTGWFSARRSPDFGVAARVLGYLRIGALSESPMHPFGLAVEGPTASALGDSLSASPSPNPRGALATRSENNDAPVLRLAGRTDASQPTTGG